ncbi:hypothetical protein MAUB_00010 [Mycolicibacterium aubagnense]|uniref:ABC transmembrane type-1 domain-containing protein n=1 Tax=Mycolicibacterium aubagnense TaxID=319707 RepID=A0ABN5YL54_9MYCO|nr:hypothetical protein MAUB_00010 [Mycolicibacterium aubagnense]
MLPGVFPFYVTGAITASGEAWNASIVAEIVSWVRPSSTAPAWAPTSPTTPTEATSRIVLGVAVMSVMVIAMNRAFGGRSTLAERRTRLD